MQFIKKIGHKLADPALVFYTLPWLMLLVVLGTIAQKELGLYQAQEMFFSSWFFWLGFIPLPGGYLTIAVIFIAVLAKFLFKSTWSWAQSGIILTHFGVLLLILGGFLTAYTAKESFMLIPEGRESNILKDYFQKGLYIKQNSEPILFLNAQDISTPQTINIPDTDIEVKILSYCKNCRFSSLEDTTGAEHRKGLAEKIDIHEIPLNKSEEANMGGVKLEILNTDDANGTYISTEAAPHAISIHQDDTQYDIIFTRKERELPFTIKLNEFQKIFHPGTNMAQHYSSNIDVIENNSTWQALIQMNEPLRYKGYTFFQSSYAETPVGPATILAVVENKGQLFPYISSIIIALGLILHLIILSVKRGRKA